MVRSVLWVALVSLELIGLLGSSGCVDFSCADKFSDFSAVTVKIVGQGRVTSDLPGIDCSPTSTTSHCTQTWTSRDGAMPITLTAEADSGWVFDHWIIVEAMATAPKNMENLFDAVDAGARSETNAKSVVRTRAVPNDIAAEGGDLAARFGHDDYTAVFVPASSVDMATPSDLAVFVETQDAKAPDLTTVMSCPPDPVSQYKCTDNNTVVACDSTYNELKTSAASLAIDSNGTGFTLTVIYPVLNTSAATARSNGALVNFNQSSAPNDFSAFVEYSNNGAPGPLVSNLEYTGPGAQFGVLTGSATPDLVTGTLTFEVAGLPGTATEATVIPFATNGTKKTEVVDVTNIQICK